MKDKLFALLVFRSADELLRVKEILDRKIESEYPNLHFDVASNEAAARDKIKSGMKNYQIVISHLHIPADSENPTNESEQCGLRLLQSIDKEYDSIYKILVSVDSTQEIVHEINKLSKCMLLIESKEFDVHLIDYCKRLLDKLISQPKPAGAEDTKTLQHKVDVEIYLNLKNRKRNFNLLCTGKQADLWHKSSGPLKIDEDEMKDLFYRSKENLLHKNWEREWHTIGVKLYQQIINDTSFYKNFYNVCGRLPDDKNIRFRFDIEKTLQPLAVEALAERDCDGKHKPWMLRAPIYRRAPVSGDVMPPLFYDKKLLPDKINCLIIESNASGPVENVKDKNGKGIVLKELKKIGDECKCLEEYLRRNEDKFKIGKINRLTPNIAPKNMPFSDYVKEILVSGTWDLVHYAGHSGYHPDDQESRGYVFFKGNDEDYARGKDIETFALWLRKAKTRFIYLSSCESAKADFVFELASKRIPSIVGFRWEIDDLKAPVCAEMFYNHLFAQKSLKYAFWNARKDMHEEYKTDRIWAAPMLITQISD